MASIAPASCRVFVVLTAVALTAAACGGGRTGPKIRSTPRSTAESYRPAPEPTASPSGSHGAGQLDLGAAPDDLRSLDWGTATVPGEFCGVPGVVTFHGADQGVDATSRTWGNVIVSQDGEARYGDLDDDGHVETAHVVSCNNGGGTAGGDLAFGVVVLTGARGRLVAVGTVTPQRPAAPGHYVTHFGEVLLTPGRVVVQERWYRDTDPSCCASGNATTTWMLSEGRLVPGVPVVVARLGT